jgi:hypothetical protein
MEVGGIEPHTRVVAQGLTPYCDRIVIVFWGFPELILIENKWPVAKIIVGFS